MAAAEQAALDASPESLRQDVAEAQAKAAEVRNKKRLCGTKNGFTFEGDKTVRLETFQIILVDLPRQARDAEMCF